MTPNTVAIIQARMGSSRLPGKVLLPLGGRPVIRHVVNRAHAIRGVNRVVVATSDQDSDDPLASWCHENSLDVFRGSEKDLADRYFRCAQEFGAEVVLRITADCPLLDPRLSSALLKGFLESGVDYARLGKGFPDGFDTQVFSFDCIQAIFREARDPFDREHVGPFVERNEPRFSCFKLETHASNGLLRVTLDYPEDYQVISAIIDSAPNRVDNLSLDDVVSFLEANPSIKAINERYVTPH